MAVYRRVSVAYADAVIPSRGKLMVTLFAAQVCGSAGHSMTMAVGSIKAASVTGTNTWAGLGGRVDDRSESHDARRRRGERARHLVDREPVPDQRDRLHARDADHRAALAARSARDRARRARGVGGGTTGGERAAAARGARR